MHPGRQICVSELLALPPRCSRLVDNFQLIRGALQPASLTFTTLSKELQMTVRIKSQPHSLGHAALHAGAHQITKDMKALNEIDKLTYCFA